METDPKRVREKEKGVKEEVKVEWVRRLRSGDYIQLRGELVGRSPEGERAYCCLGVLTDMAIEAGVPGIRYSKDGNTVYRVDEEFRAPVAASDLPYPVYSWAGLKYDGGDVATWRGRLVEMNDERGYTFEEIADVIEECL